MRNICLLSLLALNALAPRLQAQDDDAELGQAQPPSEVPRSSILDEDATEADVSVDPMPPRAASAVAQDIQQPPPPPPPSPVATAPAEEAKEPSEVERRRRPGATFGLGAVRYDKIGKYNHYDYLYGSPETSPTFYGGYYLYSYLLDFGIVGRASYYHDEGHPLSVRPDLPLNRDLTNEPRDQNQKLRLTLIPTQIAGEIALSPFRTRWVVLRAWVGMEFLYVQETVEPDLPDSATTENASTYTTSGWNQGLATGFMASFTLTGMNTRSDNSLRSLGIDRYYLSIFGENITTTHDKFGNFDRKSYGIAFSFEGLR